MYSGGVTVLLLEPKVESSLIGISSMREKDGCMRRLISVKYHNIVKDLGS